MAGDRRGGADVVGQGDGEEPTGWLGGYWWRRVVVVATVLLGLGAVSRSGLLSSGEPASTPPPAATASAGTEGTPRLVARVGASLLVAGVPASRTSDPLPGLGRKTPLGPAMLGSASPQPLVWVAGRTLFRADPARGGSRRLGRADRVVAPGVTSSRVYLVRGGRLVEAEIATGSTTDRRPFPGFDLSRWTAEGLISPAEGDTALVMSRSVADGREDLALAWSSGSIRSLGRPAMQALGTYGPVLGLAGDWVLTLRACPGPDCRIVIVSRTTDLVLARAVAPPPGWTFVDRPSAGQMHESLVTVEHLSGGAPDGHFALARLVPGGDSALLVSGTESVHLAAGLVAGPRGQVYLLTRPGDGSFPTAQVWDPDRPNIVSLLIPRVTLPPDATLVCACG